MLIGGLALLGLPGIAARAADDSGLDSKALAHQTQRLMNDAGQFYMAWWLPQSLSEAILRDSNAPQADRDRILRALQPYVVFALSRGQVGEHGLQDVHDRADLLRHSRLKIDGQTIAAAPADQNDPQANAALEMLRPTLAALLGPYGHGIEFALYRSAPGMHSPDPTVPGTLEYSLYHVRFRWQLPVWAPAAPALAHAPPAAMPVAPAIPVPPGSSAPAAAAVAPSVAPPAVPVPVQRRKIDPTTGEEFPERYNYNPYTGQKLVSQ